MAQKDRTEETVAKLELSLKDAHRSALHYQSQLKPDPTNKRVLHQIRQLLSFVKRLERKLNSAVTQLEKEQRKTWRYLIALLKSFCQSPLGTEIPSELPTTA